MKLGVPSKLQNLTLWDGTSALRRVVGGIGSWHGWFSQPRATPLFWISQPETGKVAHIRYWLTQIGLGCTGASRWNRKDSCTSTGRLRSQCGSFSDFRVWSTPTPFVCLHYLVVSASLLHVLYGVTGPTVNGFQSVSSFKQLCLLG